MPGLRQPRARRAGDIVTIRDVAARARVSTATVSRVLAGTSGGGSPLRERVLAAARSLRYEPNRLARNLRARRRRIIGVVIPDLQNPFFTGVVRGVEQTLRREGYTLLLGNSDGLGELENNQLSTLRAEGAAGLILIPSNDPSVDYRAVSAWGVPVVAVDRAPVGLQADLVKTTNLDGAREAVAHLIGLGHREIGLINGPPHLDVSRERAAGYREALAAAGLPVRPDYAASGDFRQEGGRSAMETLLRLPEPPRAVFIANNLMTLGALQTLHERGLNIPAEMAVVSFDDMPWAISLHPPLTAVAQPAEELGRTAAQLLLERLQQPDRPIRQVLVQTHLVVRASCGASGTL